MFRTSSIWCSIMGLPASGKSGFGRSRESGQKFVAFCGPAIRITDFIKGIFILTREHCSDHGLFNIAILKAVKICRAWIIILKIICCS